MEKLKDKILLVIGSIIFVALCVLAGYCIFFKTSDYYIQVDNANVQAKGPEYEYNLRAYDEHGKIKDVVFKANKELREDAYLKLEINSFRGVIFWEELQFDELPKDVQFRYDQSQ